MKSYETNAEPSVVALNALGWILSDETRASRFLSLTGLTPEDLRTRLSEPSLLCAVLAFLEGHEPDLLACADAIGTAAPALIAARAALDA